MIINLFREHQIFDNLIANQLCDELASALSAEGEYPSDFLLSGAAGYGLQLEYARALENIVFRVTSQDRYFKLLEYLDRISTREMVKYANRTYFKFPSGAVDICFMIMHDEAFETSSLEYQGIRIENYNFINPELYA